MDCYLLQFLAVVVGSLLTWGCFLLIAQLIQTTLKFIQDDKSETFNAVLRFFMKLKGFTLGHSDYNGWRYTKAGTDKYFNDGGVIVLEGAAVIIILESFAVFVYELPIAALIITLAFVGVFGARFITRISKKVKLLESSK